MMNRHPKGRVPWLPAALLLLSCGVAAVSCSGDAPPRVGDGQHGSVVLITLDTTRQDALGCYGRRPSMTPHLDALASEGVTYTRARTVAPLTLPAHASMLTGLYPPRHHLRDNNLRSLGESAETLAERAQQAGFQTAAFVSAVVLDEAFGLAQGFDHYDQPQRVEKRNSPRYVERRAQDVVKAALKWFRNRDPEQPVFLWLHFFDPHDPYDPGPEFLAQAGGDAYMGEVARMDKAIGRFLKVLRADPLWSETTVCVIGDHGEGLGEHREPTHSPWIWDSTMLVPFLLRHADGRGAGERVDAAVSVVDAFPTLLAAMGLGDASGVDGVSLFDEPDPARITYFESYHGFLNFGWRPLAGAADADHKTVFSSRPHVFQPASDPSEVSPVTGEAAGAALTAHREFLIDLYNRPKLPAEETSLLGEDKRRMLQSVGYAASGDPFQDLPGPLEPSERPDPLERVDEYLDVQRAVALFDIGRTQDALGILRGVVQENPDNVLAQDFLAGALVRNENYAQALPILRRLAAEQPTASRYYNLGGCLEATGEPLEAVNAYRGAVSCDANHIPSLRRLVKLIVPSAKGGGPGQEELQEYRRQLRELTRERQEQQ